MKFKTVKILLGLALVPTMLFAQDVKELNLNQAIELGIANSKNLKLAKNKIDQAVAQLALVKDNALPAASASLLYNHAEIPTNVLKLGGGESEIHLPRRADAFIGSVALQERLYAGGKLRYAEASTKLLEEVANLDVDLSKEDVTYAVINMYYSLYKLSQSEKVIDQNLASIAAQIKQSQQFFDQGLVTKNDVLRFKLQQANVNLTKLDAESNTKIVNYNLDILLGLGDNTEIKVMEPTVSAMNAGNLTDYISEAFANRQELKQLDLRNKVADFNIKTIKANVLPTVGVGANLYYINPNGFIPQANQFVAPVTVGANIAWNFGAFWTNKNKVSQAKIQQNEITLQKDVVSDQLKQEINSNYQSYKVALQKVDILQTSINQATENDRLLAAKYSNNIASVTDRIDAETLLYQAKINLEIAKADVGLAYYKLLKSTGKITQ